MQVVARWLVPSRSAKDVSSAVAACVMGCFASTLLLEFCFARILLATLNPPDLEEIVAASLAKGMDAAASIGAI